MPSYVSIANSAAVAVGTASRLTAPNEDTTLGRAVASVWDIEREAALRDGAWNFAIKRESLPALSAAPKHGYARKFQLPTDCLKLIEVYRYPRDYWQLEGRQIHSNADAPLDIRYLADITEPAEFDALFAKAFAMRIACAIGNRISGSSFNEGLNWQKYQDALKDARMSDAFENPPIEQAESSWIEARYASGGLSESPSAEYGFGPAGWW